MDIWLVNHESLVRLSFFIGVIMILIISEAFIPRRALNSDSVLLYIKRWINNVSLILVSSLLIRIIFPITLASFAIFVQQSEWGLLNHRWVLNYELPNIITLLISLLIFDFIIYWQHRLFHKIPLLWKLHRVHHSDQAFDVTTGIRFHPFEIILSMAIKFLVVFIFGFSASSVITFEILLNALALFSHSNVHLPIRLDRIIRKIIVTPDMHRVHHSDINEEHNSNFGFNISLWDRLFHSYQDQPKLGHKNMEIGLKQYQHSDQPKQLSKLLLMPFK